MKSPHINAYMPIHIYTSSSPSYEFAYSHGQFLPNFIVLHIEEVFAASAREHIGMSAFSAISLSGAIPGNRYLSGTYSELAELATSAISGLKSVHGLLADNLDTTTEQFSKTEMP